MPTTRPSTWGIASLLLLLVGLGFVMYNASLHEQGRPMLVASRAEVHGVCALALFVAAVCGVIAAKKQSAFWLLPVLVEGWFGLLCLFYDL